jgi:arylsulfatase A-like enzyme
MNRKTIKGIGLAIAAGAATLSAKPMNVIWIVADDLRPQLGCYGDTQVKSPHIDAFAETALRFDNAYVQQAMCSPSRNSMLSGLRPNTSGLRGFGVHLREAIPDIVTLPQHFKNNGYESRAFGKIYHIYDESMLGSEDDPESWSAPAQWPNVPVWGPERNAVRNRLIEEARAAGETFEHPHDWPRAETWDDSDVHDDLLQDGNTTSMVEGYLEAQKGREQPFFLAVGFLRPHLPFNAPKKYWDLYDPEALQMPDFQQRPQDAPKWSVFAGMLQNYHNMPPFKGLEESFKRRYLQGYLASISYVDACVGRVLKALEASGHADNTIVVFLGDHGYQVGEYNSWGNKNTNFEISTRTPLLVHVPGMGEAGKGTQQVTEFLDLYPTLAELAGLELPEHLEGKSFARLLDDPAASHREAAGSEVVRGPRIGRTIRTDEFRYTEWRDVDTEAFVAAELYDHRNTAELGYLEKANVVNDEAFARIVPKLAKQLHKLIPHN